MSEELLIYIMGVIVLSIFPTTWIVYGRFYEKGLFGKHACMWINSQCMHFGKHQVDNRWLCDNHYDQYKVKERIVFGDRYDC